MTPKYRGDRDPAWHGDSQLYYPGTADGFPVRVPRGAAPPNYRDREYGAIPVVVDAKIAVFNTWDADSMARYEQLIDRIANGLFLLHRRTEPVYVAEKGGWTWFCEWLQPYGSVG